MDMNTIMRCVTERAIVERWYRCPKATNDDENICSDFFAVIEDEKNIQNLPLPNKFPLVAY